MKYKYDRQTPPKCCKYNKFTGECYEYKCKCHLVNFKCEWEE